jgi:hypothetical protein
VRLGELMDLVRAVEGRLETFVRAGQTVRPAILVVRGQGPVASEVIGLMADASREPIRQHLRAIIEARVRAGADAIVVVAEAWVGRWMDTQTARAWVERGRSLIDFPDRIEAVTVMGACRAGRYVRMRPIVREPEPGLGPPLEEEGPVLQMRSYWIDDLPWPVGP